MPYAVFGYVHHNRRVAAMVTLRCKTDFALRTDLLQDLGQKIAMHASAFGRINEDDGWLMDNTKSVKEIVNAVADELGEPVIIDQVSIQGQSSWLFINNHW